ncbi:serine/threonine protein kinase [Candidatus Sumerlaeota bacterium]|nr:serine/threonine protein kinase [Candidatus Sumerlaeota bacterium]
MMTSQDFLKNFDIIRELGHGGMAYVFLAREKNLDRFVALKTIRTAESLEELGTDAGLVIQRIYREARALAKLNHNNILKLYQMYLPEEEVLKDKNAQPEEQKIYLALEYIDGLNLDKYVKSQPNKCLKEEEAIQVGIHIADALSYAHRMGIVHRDIKPSNIMKENNTGRIVLLDFSLSYIFGGLTQQTLTLQPIGTPEYMSPEQILHPQEVDYRTDIYSLGLVLYFMLTGHPPFYDENNYTLCNMQVEESPQSIRTIRRDVSSITEKAVLLALEKHPDNRIQSAMQMHTLLKEIQKILPDVKLTGKEVSSHDIEDLLKKSVIDTKSSQERNSQLDSSSSKKRDIQKSPPSSSEKVSDATSERSSAFPFLGRYLLKGYIPFALLILIFFTLFTLYISALLKEALMIKNDIFREFPFLNNFHDEIQTVTADGKTKPESDDLIPPITDKIPKQGEYASNPSMGIDILSTKTITAPSPKTCPTTGTLSQSSEATSPTISPVISSFDLTRKDFEYKSLLGKGEIFVEKLEDRSILLRSEWKSGHWLVFRQDVKKGDAFKPLFVYHRDRFPHVLLQDLKGGEVFWIICFNGVLSRSILTKLSNDFIRMKQTERIRSLEKYKGMVCWYELHIKEISFNSGDT